MWWGRLLLTAAAAAAVAAVSAGAGPTETSRDADGRILIDGRPVFPIVLARGPAPGSRTPWGKDGLDEVVGAGVSFLKIGPDSGAWTRAELERAIAWNRAAKARGAHTWITLGELAAARPGSGEAALLAHVVRTLVHAPGGAAIGMWKGADEPFINLQHPQVLSYAYCRVTGRGRMSSCAGRRPLDPAHLWVTIQAPRGGVTALAPYAAVTDVHGVDVYPVRARGAAPDLHRVGRWTRAVAAASGGAPVWTTLQVCPHGSRVVPTRAQERYMLYDAILNGARAIAFFGGDVRSCWNARDAASGWNWTFWRTVLRGLVSEVSSRSPLGAALAGLDRSAPLSSDDGTTQVLARQGASAAELWLIAARRGRGTARVTVSGLPAWASSGRVYTEGRTVPIRLGSLTDVFAQWDVHVYRITRAAPAR